MQKIVKSVITIAAVATIAAGATGAYFSDTATIAANSFATGKLEIRVNGQQTISGQHFYNMYPSDVDTAIPYVLSDSIMAGSTLAAKTLILNTANANDSGSGLWGATKIQVEVRDNIFMGPWTAAYNGDISALSNVDLIHVLGLSQLNPGEGIALRYKIWVPETGVNQNSLMDKSMTWDFTIEGRTN